jgi:uncharacterized protein
MSEYINNITRRKEILRDVLVDLHRGKPVEEVKARFALLAHQATAEEIAQAEQMLIEEGLPVEEIQRLCDVHVAVFRDGLDQQAQPENTPGHPVHTFMEENKILARFIQGVETVIQDYRSSADPVVLVTLRYQMERLLEFERHYLRKEMLLFPFLESYGFYGPSKVMWGIQDEIRADLRGLNEWLNGEANPDPAAVELRFRQAAQKMLDMVYKEENILFPAALERLKESEWLQITAEEEEIGYFFFRPGRDWTAAGSLIEQIHSRPSPVPQPASAQPPAVGELALNTGVLSLEQVDLMLRHLPVDITFVDENDTVRYFSQSLERIFHRTSAIIGRQVQNCHPPQSVDRVQRILDDFRTGQKNNAEFWINFSGKMVHIRYFAMRDEAGKYRGTLEVTQDITPIRALEGERRLLD